VPVEPILSAAAAIGWLGLLQWRRGKNARSLIAEHAENAERMRK
jgi:hypothetical protein